MGIESCARGAAIGLGSAGCVVGVSSAAPAVGAAILAKAGYAGYSAASLAKAGAIGAAMTTAPLSCCLSGITACAVSDVDIGCDIRLGGSEGNAVVPLTTMVGSAFVSGVGIEAAATAAVVGGGAIAAGALVLGSLVAIPAVTSQCMDR